MSKKRKSKEEKNPSGIEEDSPDDPQRVRTSTGKRRSGSGSNESHKRKISGSRSGTGTTSGSGTGTSESGRGRQKHRANAVTLSHANKILTEEAGDSMKERVQRLTATGTSEAAGTGSSGDEQSSGEIVVMEGSSAEQHGEAPRLVFPSDEALDMLYQVDETPPHFVTFLSALQHVASIAGAALLALIFQEKAVCVRLKSAGMMSIFSAMMVSSGVGTILQCLVGTRLMIFEIADLATLQPAYALYYGHARNENPCPNGTNEDERAIWQPRARKIQGALIVSACFQVFIGFSGIVGMLQNYLTPISIVPNVIMVIFPFFDHVAKLSLTSVPVCTICIALLVLFSHYLNCIRIPFLVGPCRCGENKHQKAGAEPQEPAEKAVDSTFPIFRVFPDPYGECSNDSFFLNIAKVLCMLLLVWPILFILTLTNTLPVGHPARTDSYAFVSEHAPWYQLVYPLEWGQPVFSWGASLGFLSTTFTSTLNSLGAYYIVAKFAKMPPPPAHALNRGIFVEGLGMLFSAVCGSTVGLTSSNFATGKIPIQRVASRAVGVWTGVLTIIFGLLPFLAKVPLSIPPPVFGACTLFALPVTMSSGLMLMGEASLKSLRNVYILSFAIFASVAISDQVFAKGLDLHELSRDLDLLLRTTLASTVFIASIIAFLLDNTIPGTTEERGIKQRLANLRLAQALNDDSYNFGPTVTNFCSRHTWMKWVPISPTYRHHVLQRIFPSSRRRRKRKKSWESEDKSEGFSDLTSTSNISMDTHTTATTETESVVE